eukprot:Pgem_evm1s4456
MGKVLSNLPVNIALGKMLIYGAVYDVIDPVVTIAALLSVQSPFNGKQVKALTGIDPRNFDFIEPPNLDSIELGLESLVM